MAFPIIESLVGSTLLHVVRPGRLANLAPK